ncbi:MAG TPA: DMT family transporter [Steroidobacteraceae bacterium]|nr:DMT family transporter [Steroidobacteraceae bacterium]
MSNFTLYAVSVVIWGSTWLVIKFQLGQVSPIVSVGWRFSLAALMLLIYSALRRRSLRFSVREHGWIALQGVLLFGINYIGVYLSEQYLVSGLVAVVFSLVVFTNALGMRLFFGLPIRLTAVLAATLGVTGVALIFGRELLSVRTSAGNELRGLLLALAATLVASLGNMVATRNHRHGLPVMQVNAWSMLYGAVFVLVVALAGGEPLSFEFSWPYLASLLFLALFGSALAFGAYLTLMGRIGADRAAYTAVAIPIVALLLSTAFEQLRWHLETFTGVAACIGGIALTLRRRPIQIRTDGQ